MKKKLIKYISKCCGAELTTKISPDFYGDPEDMEETIGTCNYFCTKCKLPCDIKIKKERKK